MDGSPAGMDQGWGRELHPAADSSYTLSDVVPGTYFLSLYGGTYALEDYQEAGWKGENMTAITVTAGGNVSNVDFTLDPGGTISGTVYEADGVLRLKISSSSSEISISVPAPTRMETTLSPTCRWTRRW